jgi:rod shape-determining protein MreC
MRNFLQFIIRNHFVFLFILFEIIAFVLIVTYNENQRAVFFSSSSKVAGGLYENLSNIEQYFALRKVNEDLATENAYLRTQMPSSYHLSEDAYMLVGDSAAEIQYKYRACKVVNNSVRKHFNYLTLNKGLKDGIKPDMGVLSNDGIVGIVLKCSENYSTALSLLNPRLKVSAKLKNTDFFGSISWDARNPHMVMLEEIPEHAKVVVGEEVVTSGYSATFPEGLSIGTVDEVIHPEGESFYKIRVKLSVDFSTLSYVEVVENIFQKQQLKLEEESEL